jgi:SAM-dependent methyltransferase
MEQRFTFDEVASVYGKVCPDYPDALVDDVVSYADLKPNDRIFEVGCGTGQATKSFAERGFPILATDPGSEMLRGARERLANFSNVEFLETTFEAWPTDRAAFRLIIAAQSGTGCLRRCVSRKLRRRFRVTVLSQCLDTFSGIAGAVARSVQRNLSAPYRQMGCAARGLVLANWPLRRMVFRVGFVRACRAQALRLEMAARGLKLCGFFTHEVGPPDDGASETRRAAR